MTRSEISARIMDIHEAGAPLDNLLELRALEQLLKVMDAPLMGYLVTGGLLRDSHFANTTEFAETLAKRAGSNCTVIELRAGTHVKFNVIQKIEVEQ